MAKMKKIGKKNIPKKLANSERDKGANNELREC